MTRNNLIIGAFIVVFTVGFFSGKLIYQQDVTTVKTTVQLPAITKQGDTVYLEKIVERLVEKDGVNTPKVKVDSSYYQKYIDEKAISSRLALYVDAITIKDTTVVVADDENIKVEVTSKTRGTLLSQSAAYNIKARSVTAEVNVPGPPLVAAYLGLFTRGPANGTGALSVGAKLDLNIKGSTSFSAGYDTEGYITVGISKRIFNSR
jgi:hypothetical protein